MRKGDSGESSDSGEGSIWWFRFVLALVVALFAAMLLLRELRSPEGDALSRFALASVAAAGALAAVIVYRQKLRR
ncbi:MAG TPA: hypothetical protein VMS56_13915 [Thermoanaerobaculia bacterium]|nr:hypothetical protein [Thermoanaerobaculia bacterium]